MANMEKTAQILVRKVTPELRAALIDEARQRDVSINEVAVGVISDTYGISYSRADEPRPFREVQADVAVLNIDVPDTMRVALKVMVAPTNKSVQGVILSALCRHYGLPEPEAAKQDGREVA